MRRSARGCKTVWNADHYDSTAPRGVSDYLASLLSCSLVMLRVQECTWLEGRVCTAQHGKPCTERHLRPSSIRAVLPMLYLLQSMCRSAHGCMTVQDADHMTALHPETLPDQFHQCCLAEALLVTLYVQ